MASPSRWALAVLSSLLSLQTGLDARPSTRHTPGSAGTGDGGKRRPENFAGSLLVPRNDVSKHACPSRAPASSPHAAGGLRSSQLKNVIIEPSLWSLISFKGMIMIPCQENVIYSPV